MAFRQTLVRLAPGIKRADVHPALVKAWSKHYKVDGLVTQHLSPFEQNIISPMFKDAYKKVLKKVIDAIVEAGPGLSIAIGVYYWAEAKHKDLAYHHRW